jgi:copper transport protein
MKRLSLLVLPILLALLMQPGRALAHAHLVRADLAPNSHLLVSVGTVRFWFDEPLNPTLSRILILDQQGRQVNADTGEVNPTNGEELDVTVPTLPDGLYTVRWTSDSAQDGHIMHGFYLFSVGGPGAVPIGTIPAPITGSSDVSLDNSAVLVALAHWLVLITAMLWTGAIAFELLVLAPQRRRVDSHAGLSAHASSRARVLVQLGLLIGLVASVLELEAQAYAAAGTWSSATSSAVIGAILGSRYGMWFAARVVVICLAMLMLVGHVLLPGLLGMRRWSAARRPAGTRTIHALTILGLVYLLALALSGHAGAVPHLTISAVLLDWLHLVASAIWIGGMLAIGLAVVPALLARTERWWPAPHPHLDFLALLDRFSPAAYLALIAAAFTGMFNAQIRIDSLSTLTGTTYGHLLLIKLALIGLIMALSASHVFGTRPRLRAQIRHSVGPAVATTPRGFPLLLLTLRVEPVLGVLILLCVALMGQVAPGAAVFNASVIQVTGDQSAASPAGPIAAVSRLGDLTVNLQISPADIGQARLTVRVAEHGQAVTDGQVRIKLSMPEQPALGAAFVETSPLDGGYSGAGDIVQEGLWRADVLVRTRSDPDEFRDLPTIFVAGPEPSVLEGPVTNTQYGPAILRLRSRPGAAARLEVRMPAGLLVRFLLIMPDMSPQEIGAVPEAGGWYSGTLVPPMPGYMNLAVQVREGGTWRTVRMTVCAVDGFYAMHLLL